MKRGVSFEIPNEYGSLLSKVLEPVDISTFSWRIGNGEAYKVVDGRLDENLFLGYKDSIEGEDLKDLLENKPSYIIFADLQAYPSGELSYVETYEEFMGSKCEFVLLIVDCSYVTLYCKNKQSIELLYHHAKECGFKDVEYITDDNDARTSLIAW
ncbi:DUF2691 family protein [Mesobacillus maritimus]|jgi:hypothetical protein|uniref:DUF2691 family protein n=1 Tax=Mesobacillus maritimus TaxID=1643336 RepID=A0ABS7K8A2_9BACI|nr:DUF2691 family protein [Mesobacillus maritimus]MBY0098326.1 DUF2691 family protein [Mesobacillus maritimus]